MRVERRRGRVMEGERSRGRSLGCVNVCVHGLVVRVLLNIVHLRRLLVCLPEVQ